MPCWPNLKKGGGKGGFSGSQFLEGIAGNKGFDLFQGDRVAVFT